MAALGFGLAVFVFLTVAAFIDEVVLHTKGAGILPGLVAGLWAFWPCFHQFRVSRYNFLHPVPREYKLPVPQAFAKIRDQLAEVTYNFGDKWHLATADPQTKKIVASLRFTDEVIKMETDGRGHMHMRTERVQRLLELEVQMRDAGDGCSIIQLDFLPKVEGSNFAACDSIISSFCAAVESTMGPGTERGSAADKRLPAPPWWLIAFTVLGLLGFWGSISHHLSEIRQRIEDGPRQLQQQAANQTQSEQSMRAEMETWKKFKESYNLR